MLFWSRIGPISAGLGLLVNSNPTGQSECHIQPGATVSVGLLFIGRHPQALIPWRALAGNVHWLVRSINRQPGRMVFRCGSINRIHSRADVTEQPSRDGSMAGTSVTMAYTVFRCLGLPLSGSASGLAITRHFENYRNLSGYLFT
jgi:hypothetical protein